MVIVQIFDKFFSCQAFAVCPHFQDRDGILQLSFILFAVVRANLHKNIDKETKLIFHL